MNKHSWRRIWARKYSPYIASTFLISYLDNQFGQVPNKLYVPEGKLNAVYFDADEYQALIDSYTAFLKEQDLNAYAVEYENGFKAFLAWSKETGSQDFSTFSNQELTDTISTLTKKMVTFSELQLYAFLVLEGAAKTVGEELAGEPELLEAIATPYRHIQITDARIELLQMVRDGRVTDEAVAAYVEKYAWIPIYDFTDRPYTGSDIRTLISGITDAEKELDAFERHQQEGLEKYREYFSSLPAGEFKQLVEISHYFAYLKEMRDDYRRHAYFYWLPFWDEVAKRLSLTTIEANHLLEHELADALLNGTDHSSVARDRIECFGLLVEDGVLTACAGKDALQLASLVEPELTETKQLKGTPASKGSATGTVRVVYHQGEFDKFKEGDILVTTMTHPEFMLIMKKAKAIITDEGGITCHAAIVSRELGIPCVIGTKNATRTLKDGDTVEVTGDGYVKILERA